MTTIHLHIGMHKTGSTAIQQSFDQGREAALRHGVDYPLAGRHPSAAVNEAFGRSEADFDADASQKRARDALAGRLAGSKAAKILLSAEALDRYRDRRGGALKAMLDAVSDDVRVLVYLREPVSWAASQAQQHIKHGRVTLADLRREPGQSHRRGHSIVPAYRDMLEAWFALYGRERVEVRIFDRARFPAGDVVRDICQAIGAPSLASELPSLQVNESLSAEAVRLAEAYTELERAGAIEGGGRELLERLREVPGRRFKLPGDIAEAVLRATAEDRAWLAGTLGIDLTPSAPEPEDDGAWSDAAVTAVVEMLATPVRTSPWSGLAALFRRGRRTRRG